MMLVRAATRARSATAFATSRAAALPARARFSNTATSRESTENRAIAGSSDALIKWILAREGSRKRPPSFWLRGFRGKDFSQNLNRNPRLVPLALEFRSRDREWVVTVSSRPGRAP